MQLVLADSIDLGCFVVGGCLLRLRACALVGRGGALILRRHMDLAFAKGRCRSRLRRVVGGIVW